MADDLLLRLAIMPVAILSAPTPETTPEMEALWDDGDLIAWDDGDVMAWD